MRNFFPLAGWLAWRRLLIYVVGRAGGARSVQTEDGNGAESDIRPTTPATRVRERSQRPVPYLVYDLCWGLLSRMRNFFESEPHIASDYCLAVRCVCPAAHVGTFFSCPSQIANRAPRVRRDADARFLCVRCLLYTLRAPSPASPPSRCQ